MSGPGCVLVSAEMPFLLSVFRTETFFFLMGVLAEGLLKVLDQEFHLNILIELTCEI